jgi:surface protein
MRWTGPNVPSPYFVQANPRGTPQSEWFAIVDDSTSSNITDYAKNIESGISYFTPPGAQSPIPFNNIVTTLVTDMSSMFYNATTFDHPIGSWDTMNVTNMHSMFENAEAFNQDVSKWNTMNVTDMSFMFYYAQSFERDIGKWMTRNVTDMSYMFYEASKFNSPVNQWMTRNVTTMSHMFYGASKFNSPVYQWNTRNVKDMSYMFFRSIFFNQPISPWYTKNVTNMSHMFHNALNFNQYLGNLNVKHLSEPDNFSTGSNLSVLNKPNWGGEPIDTVILDVNGVTAKWTGLTVPSPYFVQANPRGTPQPEWFAIVDDSTSSNITDYAKNIESGISYFTPPGAQSPIPFNNIVTPLVTDMSSMFYNASTFDHPIGSWDTSNVRNMRNMFYGASVFNQNISVWNTMNVTDTRNMFYGAVVFNLNQDISSWNTTNMINSYSSMLANFMYKAYIKDTSDYNDGDESYDTIQEVDEDQFEINLTNPFIIDSLSFNTIYIHSNGSIHFKQASTTYTYPYPWNYFALFCFGADLNVIENDFIRYKEIDDKFIIIYNCRYFINEDVVDATYASAQFQVKITLHLESSTNSGMIAMDFGTTNSIPVPTLLGTSFGSKIESYLNTNINFLDHPESEPYIFNYTNTPLQEIQDMQSGYSNKQLVIRPVQ